MTAYARIEDLLKQRIGLDTVTVGRSNVERAVRARMAACKLADPTAYLARLASAQGEVQELIEAVVVPETWFFRDPEVYAALARIACEEWLRAGADANLRLLSVPCATGEEAYSIAMTLFDAGVPPARWSIDAADVSARAIAHALTACYRRNSFRGADLAYRARHFEAVEGGHCLRAQIRQRVRFRHGNLLAEDFPFAAERYEAIFCRNLLIYFDRPTQDAALQVLERLLAPQGVLFVGAAETGLLLDHGWAPVRLPRAFAFRRQAAARPSSPQTAPASAPATRFQSADGPRAMRGEGVNTSVPRAAPAARAPVSSLEAASRFADRGHFAEAARLCEQHLQRHGPSAQAYYLLGLVREAAGDASQAEGFYRKALYLEPNHADTLAHLALLKSAQGDDGLAQRLRERIRRLDATKER